MMRIPAAELMTKYDASEGGFNPPLSIEVEKSKKETRRLEILRKIRFQNLRQEENGRVRFVR